MKSLKDQEDSRLASDASWFKSGAERLEISLRTASKAEKDQIRLDIVRPVFERLSSILHD